MYGHVITKFSRMGSLPHFLTYGAPLRVLRARESSAKNLRICSCLACVYRVMDARGKFREHERCVRFARGDSRVQL